MGAIGLQIPIAFVHYIPRFIVNEHTKIMNRLLCSTENLPEITEVHRKI